MDRARLSDPPVSPRARRGLTFVEVMIVVVILAIVALTGISAAGGGHASKLIAAAQTLAADIDYARAESAAHGDALRVLVVDAANDRYHIAIAGDTATPITHPVATHPHAVHMGGHAHLERRRSDDLRVGKDGRCRGLDHHHARCRHRPAVHRHGELSADRQPRAAARPVA